MRKTGSLSDQIYNLLRRKIVECELLPGSFVTQNGLIEIVGNNRGALREALLRLTQEGFLMPVPRKGYVVSPLTIKDVEETMQLRILLEGEAARLAAGRISRSTLEEIRDMFSVGYKSTDKDSISKYIDTNRKYKICLAKAAGNDLMAEKISELLDRFERYLRILHLHVERHEEMYVGFEETVEALMTDGEKAKKLTQSQLYRTKDIIINSIMQQDSIRNMNIKMQIS